MATTSRKNLSVKALQTKMASEKKYNDGVMYEWEMSCNTNIKRGRVYKQEDILKAYSRRVNWNNEDKAGATKVCHLKNENGENFQYIVIKRMRNNAYIPNINGEHAKCTGNQLIDEINCWIEFQERSEADLLCPILKYFTSKSDKVSATSDTMQNNVIIIAQKAVYIDSAKYACKEAERLNKINGFKGEDYITRYAKLEAFSVKQGWRDAMYNGGNSGVIFDYNQNCYKAVFIDYAL
jgi:hypothetical protein